MNIIILVLVVLISIALLYLIFKRSLSESTLILQKTDLNTIDPITFDVAKIYNADSKQFTYSTWINIERTATTDRTIIDRPSEIKIELKKDEPIVLVSVYLAGSLSNLRTISIERFPLKKRVFLTVCVTDKTVKINDGDTTHSVVDVYMNGKLIKSAQTATPVTPDLVSGLKIGTKASNDYIPRPSDDIQVQASPWATLYGLKRSAFCMLPKQVNDEYKSYVMLTNGYGVNIALSEKDIIKKDYALF